MPDPNDTDDRDEVLFAFQQECERPTAEQIIKWTSRFPQYADDIRAHAAVALDWAAREGLPVEELTESLAARGYSQALNLIHSAETSTASNRSASACQTFQAMLNNAETDVPRLARQLDIGRTVLADLFNGWMLAPVRRRVVDAIVSALKITVESFNLALLYALDNPRLGHAKSDKTPTITPRSCDEIIRDSNMPSERKRYWLEED
ncbi:MAG TPA: hypothetical protein VHW24_26075 [Bryobacteraceae bacterium]|jgi:hypothetical protein|nr:hypothetical protein [Bryobacteraceae bacterium]